MVEKSNILKKVYVFFFLLVAFGFGLVGQIINIQFFSKEEIQNSVAVTTARYNPIPADRGDLYSSDGSLLATSLNEYIVGMDLASDALTDENFKEYLPALCDSLASLIGTKSAKQYREELRNSRKSRSRWYKISNSLTYPEFKRLQNFPLFKLGKYKSGLVYQKVIKRKKPFGILASRTIGSKPPIGLEGAYDDLLKGRDGEQFQRKIPGGIWVPVNDNNSVEPQDGMDVYSTIDINIQEVAENALRDQLFYNKADYGCAIVMEVKTGKVRAIANLRVDTAGNYWEDVNYAIGDAVEPGSTFKLASMMALLEDGKMSLDEKVDVGYGVMQLHDRKVKDSHPYAQRTIFSAKEVFMQSSNVGTVKLVMKYFGDNPRSYIDRLYGFGLHNRLNLDIQGEAKPVIKDPNNKENWYGTTLAWTSFGYETQFTPMQILAYYNAVANDGKMMKPYFVEKVMNKEKLVEEYGPVVLNSAICSQETVKKLQELLVGVVEEGTGKGPFRNSLYKVAGKTGTSQINYAGKSKDRKSQYRGSFCGYFPADNPVYSCIVVITNPTEKGFYGGSVAAPVFRVISDRVYAMDKSLRSVIKNAEEKQVAGGKVGIENEMKLVTDLLGVDHGLVDQTRWVEPTIQNNKMRGLEKQVESSGVHNVIGMTFKDALYLLENQGLKVTSTGSGKVVSQSIQPGSAVSRGKIITLTLK